MGDAHINRGVGVNPRIELNMVSPKYLKHIRDVFGVLGSDVRFKRSAKDSAKQVVDRDFKPNVSSKNYNDVYEWYSVCHPELQKFAGWYSSGKKVWPEDIELTPTVLKHWYCGDGYFNDKGHHKHISIAMSNEVENTDKVDKMFKNVGLPSPSNYSTSGVSCNADFTTEQSKELWKYMGNPLPDFGYKWPKQYR